METVRCVVRLILGAMLVFSLCFVARTQATLSIRQADDCVEGTILFFSNLNGENEIWAINAHDGSDLRQYLLTDSGVSATTPAWSAANGRLAYTHTESTSYQDIFLTDPYIRNQTNLTGTGGGLFPVESREFEPAWSPDGTRIAFAADDDGIHFDVWVMNIDGKGAQNLTKTETYDEFSPTWSTDGTRIAFVSNESEKNSIWIINLSNLEKSVLIADPDADDFAPAWSPSSNWIAFTRRYSDNTTIYVMNVDNGYTEELTTSVPGNEVREAWAAWSPDGHCLVFSSNLSQNSPLATFDLYAVRVFDDTGNMIPQITRTQFKIGGNDLNESDEFAPVWIEN